MSALFPLEGCPGPVLFCYWPSCCGEKTKDLYKHICRKIEKGDNKNVTRIPTGGHFSLVQTIAAMETSYPPGFPLNTGVTFPGFGPPTHLAL